MALNIHKGEHRGIPVLEVSGKIGDPDTRRFAELVADLYNSDHAKTIIDLRRVNAIDSQGLGTIVSSSARMAKEGRELVLLTSSDPKAFIPSLLKMTNLYKVLKIITDLDEVEP